MKGNVVFNLKRCGQKEKVKSKAGKASLVLALCCFGWFHPVCAQKVEKDSSAISGKLQEVKAVTLDGKKIEITQSLQLWDVHTFESLGNQILESRNDLYIRRGRLGVKGYLQKNVSFNVAFAYDGIGRDKNTAGNGSPNPDDNHDFFLWEAFTMWEYKPLLNITAGYFRPQLASTSPP